MDELLQELGALEDVLRSLQSPDATSAEVASARDQYYRWYARARRHVPASEAEKFEDLYEGGLFITRIKGYLANPTQSNRLNNPGDPNPLMSPWQYPFETTAGPSLLGQRQILAGVLHAATSMSAVLEELSEVMQRLPEYLRTLERYGSEQAPPPALTNEKGLQVVVHSVLRLLYRDVRAEDFISQHAGASSRVDFLLAQSGVLVETKMTRPGLADRKVGEELLIDWGRYKRHPDCHAILALVYDPDFQIDNPTALESSLTDLSANVPTKAIVIR